MRQQGLVWHAVVTARCAVASANAHTFKSEQPAVLAVLEGTSVCKGPDEAIRFQHFSCFNDGWYFGFQHPQTLDAMRSRLRALFPAMKTDRCYAEGGGAGSEPYSEYDQVSMEAYLSSFICGFKVGAKHPLLMAKYAHVDTSSGVVMQPQDAKLEVSTEEAGLVQVSAQLAVLLHA